MFIYSTFNYPESRALADAAFGASDCATVIYLNPIGGLLTFSVMVIF